MSKTLVFLMTILVALANACSENGCDMHVDFGSCGNACCKLAIITLDSPARAVEKLNGTISAGGPDNQYSPQVTAGGNIFYDDLRPYNIDVDFIGQSYHVADKGTYTDTQNWVVFPEEKGGSKIIGFSISQIGGAYGDNGQNWYNINNVFSTTFPDSKVLHVDGSCKVQSSSKAT